MHNKGRTHETMLAGGRRALAILLSFVMVTSGVPTQAIAEAGNSSAKDVAAQTAEESAREQATEQTDEGSKITDKGQETNAATSNQTTDAQVNAPPADQPAEESTTTEQPSDLAANQEAPITDQQSFPSFNQTVEVDGMQVRVTAPEGTYPADSKLEVTALPEDQAKNVNAAVEAVRDPKQEVASSRSIQVTIRNKDGNEVQVAGDAAQTIAFYAKDYANDTYSVQVYAISDAKELEAKKANTTKDGNFNVVTPADATTYCVQYTREAERQPAEQPAKMPAFSQQAELDGVKISVTAAEGVFPEGAKLDAKKVSATDEQKASDAVDEVRDTSKEVAASYTFDIKIVDKGGAELQPADDAKVNVSFATAEVAKKELTTEVFHIDDQTGKAESLAVNESGTTAKVEVDGFSIYVINFAADGKTVESPAFATYKFYNNETDSEGSPVRSQKVKVGDDLYEPSTPVAPTGKKFVGWYVGNEKLNFTSEGKLNLATLHVSNNGVVRVVAHYDTYRYVTFYDQDDHVFTRMSVVDGGTIEQSALPTFTPKLSTQTLKGWTTDKNGTTPVSFPLTNIKADANYYPIIEQSHVLTFDANRLPHMKENATTGTKQLTVSYTPPQTIAPDGTTTEPTTAPTCESSTYTFGGWYTDPACTTPFTFGQALSQDTTVYAKWIEGKAKYKVVVWKEKISVFYDNASRNKLTPENYEYYKSEDRYALPLSTVSLGQNDNFAYDLSADGDKGFEVASYGRPAATTVMPDGSTVLNVYWNRQTVTSRFYLLGGSHHYESSTGHVYTSASLDHTLTGLYGQSFAMYKSRGNTNYVWPTMVTGKEVAIKYQTGSYYSPTNYWGLTEHTAMRAYFNDSLAEEYYMDPQAPSPTGNMRYVLQKADGSWPTPNEAADPSTSNGSVIAAKTNSSGTATIGNSFANFNVTGYSQGTYWYTASGRTPISDGGTVQLNSQTFYLYFDRVSYDVEFYNKNGQKNTSLSGSRLYGSSLADCANPDHKLADTDTERFVGWATSPGETSVDKAVDFTKLTVPDYTLAFYPIYATDQVNVKLNLAGTEADAAEVTLSNQQSRSFWPNVNTTIDMTLMNQATRDGYELEGWYTQDGTKWTEGLQLVPELCAKDANKKPILNEPAEGYSSAYYTITLTARWHATAQAQVVYTGEGVSGIADPDTYTLNGDVKVSSTHPTNSNKTFIGWRDLNGNMHQPGDTFTFDSKLLLNSEGKLELTAVYTAKENPKTKVTYHANYSGSSATSDSDPLQWNDTLVLPSDTFTRNGYRITGWSTTPGATAPEAGFETGKTVGVSAMGATILEDNTATIDLYATWEDAATLTFAPNNAAYGSVDKTSILVGKYTTDSVTVVATPADGYHLVNWTKDGSEVSTATTLTLTKPEGGWTNASYVAVFHKHDWSWAANANTVVAICGNSDGAHKGDTTVTLTLNVEDVTYLTPVSASVDNKAGMEATGTTVGEVTFVGRGSTTYAESTKAPELAGTYTAKVTVSENSHTYTATKDFTIKPKEPSDAEKLTFDLADDPQTYDGNAHTPKVTNVKLGDIELEEDRGYRVEYVDNVNAGTATAKVILMGNFSGEASKTFTINKADITPTIDVASRAYDGKPVEPVIGNNPGNGAVTSYSYEKRNADGSWSTFTGMPTDAGTYRAKATIAETTNYKGATTNTKEFTISKANPVVTAPTANDLTYNGQAQDLVVPGTTTGGKMLYSLDGNTWNESVPKATDQGTYTVYYKVDGNDNYNSVEPKTVAVTIGAKTLNAEDYTMTLSETEFTYNKEEQKPTVTITLKDGTTKLAEGTDFDVKYFDKDGKEIVAADSKNATDYKVKVVFKGNYAGESEQQGYKIKSKPLSEIDVNFTGDNFTYTGNPQGPTITVKHGDTTLTELVNYTVANGTATNVNPVGSPYTVTVTGMGNYTGTVTHNYTISKDALDPTKLADAQKPTAKTGLTYNGTDQELVNAPTSVPTGYTMQYSLDGNTWSDNLPTGKDAGTYNVHVKYKGDANHADVILNNTIPVTIGKKPVTITPQSGQTKVFGASEPATYTYSQDGVVSGDTLTGKLGRQPGENVGSYAFTIDAFTATGANPNYDVKLAASAPTFSITKADQATPATPVLTATPNSVTVNNGKAGVTYTLYDKDGNAIAGKVTTPNADGSVTFDGLNPAEQYTVKAQIAADDNHNASPEVQVSITTPKESQTAPAPTLENGASSFAATDGAIKDVNDTMEYSTDGGATWVSVPVGHTTITGLPAGEVLVRYEGDETKEPSPAAKVMVTFKLTGKVKWNYEYSYVDPQSGEQKTATVADTSDQRSKYARVVLYNGANPIVGRSEVVNVSENASGDAAEGTYDFNDLPTADEAGNRINYHAEITPLMSADATEAATGYSVNYIDTMHLQAEISFGQECFDAPWQVTVNSIDAPNGAKPDAVFVKVLYGTTADGVQGGMYDGYDIITQQSAGNGSTCTLVPQQDGSYVATGSYPVWKWQPGQTGDARQSYYHRILVTGYIANGTFFSLVDEGQPNNSIMSGKNPAMTYTGNDQNPASATMTVTIDKISVPSVEFDPNGDGATIQNGYIVVEKNGTVTAAQINAKVPTWTGHVFDGWYDAPTGGNKQTADITNITEKKTLYAHWKMVVDPVTNAPTAKDLTYNGQAQELVNAPSELPAGCKKIQYSLDGTNWTDDLPKAVDAGTYTVKVKYVGEAAHADAMGADIQVTIKPKPLTADMLSGKGTSLIYSGVAQGPTVTVKDGATTLAKDTDYTLTDIEATTAGSYAVKVTGTGNYTGTVQQPFTISPYELQSDDKLVIDGVGNFTYNGQDQRPGNVTVKLVKSDNSEVTLREGADFEVEYPAESVNAGNYEIKVKLKNNYKGEATKGYKIVPRTLTADMVVPAPDAFVYSGVEQGPKIVVRDTIAFDGAKHEFVLVEGADYRLTGNTAVGVGSGYKAVISGTGNYMGRVEKPFSIVPYKLTEDDKLEILLGAAGDTFTYNGADQRPGASEMSVRITKEDGTVVTLDQSAFNVTYLDAAGAGVADDGSKNAGVYQVKVELVAESGYTGTAKRGYVINPRTITADDVEFNGPSGFEYTYATQTGGTAQPQGPTTKVTSELVSGKTDLKVGRDYTVADAPQGAAGTYTMVVKGMGNFCGEVTQPYTIRKAQTKESDLTDANKPTVNKTEGKDGLVYNADEQSLVTGPTAMPAGYEEVLYSIDGGTTWTTEPKGVDVGDYTVQVKYVGDKNHEDFTIAPLTAKIVQRPVTFTGKSGELAYNGQRQTVEGYDPSTGDNEGLLNNETLGHTTSKDGVNTVVAKAEGTAASTTPYAGTITAADDVKVYDKTGTDVTKNYAITTTAGQLTITAAAVTDDGTIDDKGTGKSGDKEAVEVVGHQDGNAPTYDAEPHKPVVVDKQATDENGNPAPKTLVEGTDYDVTYYKKDDIDSDGNLVSGATPVTPEEAGEKVAVVELTGDYSGTIKVRVDVKQRPVTFRGQTAERTYIGKVQEITGITVEGDGLVTGHTHNLSYSAKGTAKSPTENDYAGAFTYGESATAVVIKDADGADVTKNYQITDVTTTVGKLTIKATNVDGNNDGTADNLTDDKGDTVTDDNDKPVHVVDLIGTDGTNAPVYDDQDHKPTVWDNGYVNPTTGEREPKKLEEGVDYTIAYYEANPDGTPNKSKEITGEDAPKVAGDKVAVVTFTGDYSGSLNVPVDVQKRPVTFAGKTVTSHFDTSEQALSRSTKRIAGGVPQGATMDPDDGKATTYTVSGNGLVDGHKTTPAGEDAADTVNYDVTHTDAGVYPVAFADGITIYRADGTTDVTKNYDITTTTGTFTILRSELHDNGNGWGVIPNIGTWIHGIDVIHVYEKTLNGTGGAAAEVYDGTPKKPIVRDEQEEHSAIDLVEGTDYDVVFYAPSDVTYVHDDQLNTDTKPLIKEGARQMTAEEAGEKIAVVTLKGNMAGTITAHMDVKQRPVKFTGKSDTKAYNGQKQSVTGYNAINGENEGLLTGHTTTRNNVDSIEAIAEGTAASTTPYAGTITAADDVKIWNKDGADVTKNYAVTTEAGSLTITKTKVTDGGNGNGVKAGNDGKPIDNDGNTTTDPTKYVKVVDVRGKDGDQAPIYDGTPKVPEVYDYQNKDSEGNPKKLEEGKDYTVKYYVAGDDGQPTTTETNPTDAGDKVAVVTLTGDYEGTVNTPADVRKRPAVFTGDSKSFSYDGKKHVVESLTVKDQELVQGHTYSIRYLAEGTEKGEYPGKFVKYDVRANPTVIYDADHTSPITTSGFIFDANGKDVTANYVISFALGTLSIGATKVSDYGNGEGVEVNDEGNPVVGPDGKPAVRVNVTVGYDDGNTPVYDGEDHAPTVHDVQGNKDLTQGTDYTVNYYEPQRNDDGTVKKDDKGRPVPNKDKPLSAADAGTGNDGDKVTVVEFIKDYTGEVTIGTNVSRRPVTFTGKSGEKSYNGTRQTIEGYDASTGTNEGLLTAEKFGHNTEVGGKDTVVASASGTKLGSYEGTITAATDVTIMSKDGVDVTKNYTITTAPGTITIKAAKVTDDGNGKGYPSDNFGNPVDDEGKPAKRDDDGKLVRNDDGNPVDQDGKPIKPAVDVKGTQDGNKPIYDGTPKEPVVTDNKATDDDGNPPPKTLEKGKDYTVEYFEPKRDEDGNLVDDDGKPTTIPVPDKNKPADPADAGEKVAVVTLTGDYEGTINVPMDVAKRQVTLAGKSEERAYNGKEQQITDIEVGGDGLVEGHAHNLTFSAKGTNVGTYEGTMAPAGDVKITDKNGKDVTKNYEAQISETAGTLTIKAAKVADDGKGGGIATNDDGKPVDENGNPTTDPSKQVKVVDGKGSDGDDAPVYDGTPRKPEIYDNQSKDKDGNPKKLEEGKDYDVKYYTASDVDENGNPKPGAKEVDPADAGDKVAVITLKGDYEGTICVPVDVKPRPLHVTTGSAEKTYDGKELTSSEAKVEGLVEGETVEVKTTGKQTEVGQSANTYVVIFADGSSADAPAQSDSSVKGESSPLQAIATVFAPRVAYAQESSGIASSGKATAKRGNYSVNTSEGTGTLKVTAAKSTPTPSQGTTGGSGATGTTTTTRAATAKTSDTSMAVMPFLASAAAALVAGLRRRKRK